MNYLMQFMVIGIMSFVGELLNRFLPLPVPASVYGLLLMLLCLFTRVVKLEQVEEGAGFLIHIMPVLFLPASVSLITVIADVADSLFAIGVITLVSTLVVMVVTGKVAQLMVERKKAKEDKQK